MTGAAALEYAKTLVKQFKQQVTFTRPTDSPVSTQTLTCAVRYLSVDAVGKMKQQGALNQNAPTPKLFLLAGDNDVLEGDEATQGGYIWEIINVEKPDHQGVITFTRCVGTRSRKAS